MKPLPRVQAIETLLWNNPHFRYPVPVPQSAELAGHFPIALTLDSLTTGPSDYDMPSDEIRCPCGVDLDWPTGTVGEAVRLSTAHLREAHGK